jgi:hypothetical protein
MTVVLTNTALRLTLSQVVPGPFSGPINQLNSLVLPFGLLPWQDRAWIVQTAAPLENRWIKWQRHDYVDIFVMDHPSIKEVAVLGFVSLQQTFLGF